MKKLLMLLICGMIWAGSVFAQSTQYMVFEFIKVSNEQLFDYIEYKDFMEKVYRQALNDKLIKGWEYWRVQNGEGQSNYQCIMVTYYDDPVKMMNGMDDETIINYTKIAYPHLNDEQVRTVFQQALGIRELPMRLYMKELSCTQDQFQFKPGILASFDLMKAVEGRYQDYEKAEIDVFKPIHQNKIAQGMMGHWSFLRAALPQGSEASSTHLTMNLFKDYVQFFNSQEYEDMHQTAEQRAAVNAGLNSRDQKWIYLATLENVVR